MKPKVAIVYHYLAHYRLPVFQELMKSDAVEYTIFSGDSTEIPIKQIDSKLSEISTAEGGLRWQFLKNKWFLKNLLWQQGLIRIILKEDFDGYIFLGNPYHISTWPAAIIARLKQKKVYYWMHGLYTYKLKIPDYIKIYLFYKIPNGFFLYGNRALNCLTHFKVKPKTSMHVIYNSLDYEKNIKIRKKVTDQDIKNYRNSYFKDEKIPVIIFIGRVNSIKKVDYLIEAQEILKKQYNRPVFNLMIVGSGEEVQNLKDKVTALNAGPSVYFFGGSYDEQVNGELLMCSDICVTPGEVGLTSIHAMSYGTPVISHNDFDVQMPEVESIMPGKTGAFFEKNNVIDLATVINKWLIQYPTKSEIVSNYCYEVIDTYYNPIYQSKIIENIFKD